MRCFTTLNVHPLRLKFPLSLLFSLLLVQKIKIKINDVAIPLYFTLSKSQIPFVSMSKFLCKKSNSFTVLENYSKCRIWPFLILAFSTNFCPIEIDLSGNTVWPQASGSQKLAIFDIFNEMLSTQNVNIARFDRNIKWDFFLNFQTPWKISSSFILLSYKS